MKCYKHSNDIVVQCHGCGKGLCESCSKRFSVILCEDCLLSNNEQSKRNILKQFSIMGIFYVLAFFEFLHQGFFQALFGAYFIACIPWGWSILNRITPNIFLFMSWMGWVLYFAIKAWISIMIGFAVAPFKIYRAIKDWKAIDELNTRIQRQAI
jgi:hypothetical protein